MRGHFPSDLAANKEYSFILLHTSADKRSGGVSGAQRGGQGRDTGLGGGGLSFGWRRHRLLCLRQFAGSQRDARVAYINPNVCATRENHQDSPSG
jgi:hypothetical protein